MYITAGGGEMLRAMVLVCVVPVVLLDTLPSKCTVHGDDGSSCGLGGYCAPFPEDVSPDIASMYGVSSCTW